MASLVDVLQDHEAVVAAGHPQAPPQRRHDLRAARTFDLLVAPEITIEMLVVADLVVCYAPRHDGEYRIRAGARQSGVIAGRARLDDTARRQLQAAYPLQRHVAIRPEFLDKPAVRRFPVEFRP